MDYKEKYEIALEGIQEILGSGEDSIKMSRLQLRLQGIFPELKESEDEKIRQFLIHEVTETSDKVMSYRNMNKKDVLDWLEKQGEQKPIIEMKSAEESLGIDSETYNKIVDECIYGDDKSTWGKQGEQKSDNKVEPKFHEGEWIVWQGKCYKVNYNGCGYEFIDQNGLSTSLEYGTIDESAYLWDITKDARDGDVLVTKEGKRPFIFEGFLDKIHPESPVAYCGINTGDEFVFSYNYTWWTDEEVCPATKEQRDQLEKAMADAGYIFDFDKKELKKIEQIQVIDYPDSLPKDNWELVHEFVEKFGRIPKDEDELNVLIEYVLKRQKSVEPQQDMLSQEKYAKAVDECVYGEKSEWSEEDENNILFLTSIIEECFKDKEKITLYGDTVCANFTKKDVIDRLKSLRSQSTWKPSDEQMEELRKHSDNVILRNLYYSLKKLREE